MHEVAHLHAGVGHHPLECLLERGRIEGIGRRGRRRERVEERARARLRQPLRDGRRIHLGLLDEEELRVGEDIACHLEPVARGLDDLPHDVELFRRGRLGHEARPHEVGQHQSKLLGRRQGRHVVVLHGPEFLGIEARG